jgi:hypothetical protein
LIKKFFILGNLLIFYLKNDLLNSFSIIISLYLKKKNNKILKKMFFVFFFLFSREKEISFYYNNKQIQTILYILCKILIKSNKNFLKKHIFKLKIISIIFCKLVFSKLKNFQTIGLKGVLILIRKEYFSNYLPHLIYYISFLSIKCFFLDIKLLGIKIIKIYISNPKHSEFRKIFTENIIIKYLNNQKSLFRFNSLNLILKILFNLKYHRITKKINKIFSSMFFHFLFDFDFLCRFFSGIICKIIFSIITCTSINFLFKKTLKIILSANKLIDTRTDIFLDWIYIISSKRKSYCYIKFFAFPRLLFLFKNTFDYSDNLVYLYMKMKIFFCLLIRNREFLNFRSIGKIFIFFSFNSIRKKCILIMEKLLQIFIFFFKNFFNGYINSFIHINQHIVFKFILSVYEISKNFQSLIKKQFNFLIIFFFRNNFFPSLLNYNKRIYPIFNNNKSRGHSLINILIKFFKKTDVLLLIMTFFYLFFY